jgi:hypothetical protein
LRFGSPEEFSFGDGLFRIGGSAHLDDRGMIPAFDKMFLNFTFNPLTDNLGSFQICLAESSPDVVSLPSQQDVSFPAEAFLKHLLNLV